MPPARRRLQTYTSQAGTHTYPPCRPLAWQEPNKPVTKRTRWRQALHLLRSVLRFLLVNWYKFIILGVIITLIVLVSVKGFSIFGVILRWFQARNNWGGWGIFVGMYTGLVALFLPGVVFIMGAGFVFGYVRQRRALP